MARPPQGTPPVNTQEYTTRLDTIFREHSPEEICRFLQIHSHENRFVGYVILDHYLTRTPSTRLSRIKKCFVAPMPIRNYSQSVLDWTKIGLNLESVLTEARELKRQGHLIEAAEMCIDIIVTTYKEFRDDHPHLDHPDFQNNLRNPEALDLLRSIVLSSRSGLSSDERRRLILSFKKQMRVFKPKDRFCRVTQFMADARAIISPSRSIVAILEEKINTLSEPDNHPYVVRLVRHHLKRASILSKSKAPAERNKAIDLIGRYPNCREAFNILVENTKPQVSSIPIHPKYDALFSLPEKLWFSGDAKRGLPIRLQAVTDTIRKYLAQGRTHNAVTRYLQLLRAMVKHYPFGASVPKETTAACGRKAKNTILPPDDILHRLYLDLLSQRSEDLPLSIKDRALLAAGHVVVLQSPAYQVHGYPSYLKEIKTGDFTPHRQVTKLTEESPLPVVNSEFR